MPLRLDVEDIYFIVGLSRRGEIVNLRAHGFGGGLTIIEYIVVYFLPKTEKGWKSSLHECYSKPQSQIHSISFGKVSIIRTLLLGFQAFGVLRSRLHEREYI